MSARPGALPDLRILELCDESGVFAGKLFADMGADVIKVEPPRGDPTRLYAPFLDDEPDPERSLWFWHYNTSKRGITLNLECPEGVALFRSLAALADVVIETQPPGRMAELGLDYPDLRATNDSLVMISITPFGRNGPRSGEQATDLTLAASGGFAWSSGYDDHSLPPIVPGGNNAYQTGSHFAFMTGLVALLHRETSGRGQHIDVNIHAAVNVTTEAASYEWLVAGQTVQRVTGRHASVNPSPQPMNYPAKDGIWVATAPLVRRPEVIEKLRDWLDELGILESFDQREALEEALRSDAPDVFSVDPAAIRRIQAITAAQIWVAKHVSAYEFFTGAQRRGFQASIIYSPEEVFDDPHFRARGFGVPVPHPEIGREITYPGAPYPLPRSPWSIRRRAPQLGEHNAAVYGELLDLSEADLERLRAQGVV